MIVDQMTHDNAPTPPLSVQQDHPLSDAVVGGTSPRLGQYIMESGIGCMSDMMDPSGRVRALVQREGAQVVVKEQEQSLVGTHASFAALGCCLCKCST